MKKMKTLKWSKDEQFIKTPEYENRMSALFDSHFGQAPTLAGAKLLKKKTSKVSDVDTSSGASSSSEQEKANSAGGKKRSSQSKEAKVAAAARKKRARFSKNTQVVDLMEECCVAILWVHKADFTGQAERLKQIPFKYDRVACFLVALLSLLCTGSQTRMVRRRSNGCQMRRGFGINVLEKS